MTVLVRAMEPTTTTSQQSNLRFQSKSLPSHWILFSLIVAFLLVSRFVELDKGVWLDEFSSINVITRPGSLLTSLRSYDHPPLYFILLKFWSHLVGGGESQLRLFSVFLAVLTQVVCFSWLRRDSPVAALIACFLLATIPILFRYSQEIRQYQLLLLLTTGAFWASSSIIDNAARRLPWIILAVLFMTMTLVHPVSPFIVVMVVAYLAADSRLKSIPLNWTNLVLIVLLPAASLLFVYFWFLVGASSENISWVPSPSLEILAATVRTIFGLPALSYLPPTLADQPFLTRIYPLFIIVVVVLLLFFLSLGNWRKTTPFLFAGLFYWLSVLLFSIYVSAIFWDRIMLPSLIPLVIFVALQLESITNKRARYLSYFVVVIIGVQFVSGWISGGAGVPSESWRAVAETLMDEISANDTVIVYPPYSAGPLLFYYPDLASSDRLHMPELGSLEVTARKVNEDSRLSAAAPSAADVYLVARVDAAVAQQYGDDFQDALRLLQGNFHTEILLEDGLLIVHKYE